MIVPATAASIASAVTVLRAGGLVAIPTETVYGLAADASNDEAMKALFQAKGRPANHPLIVHLSEAVELDRWAHVCDEARLLAEAFWPGPLTLVLTKRAAVSSVLTGGRETVAVRVPAHPVARDIIAEFGGGLAAPSANRFGRVSPTTAADVAADLGDRVPLIIDGGSCSVGVESTIVEITHPAVEGGQPQVMLLRPGGITADKIAAVLGQPVSVAGADEPSRAPGMLASHYSPATHMELCPLADAAPRAASLRASGARVGIISLHPIDAPADVAFHAGGDPAEMARSLYRWLHQADADALDVVLAVPPPEDGLNDAVRDRLRRAAAPRP